MNNNDKDLAIANTTFWSIVSNGIKTIISEAPEVWTSSEYKYEQSLVEKNCTPLYWGMGCMLATFVSFRLGGNRRVQHYRVTQIRKLRKQPLPPPLSPLSPRQRQEEMKKELISIPADFVLSILLGISTFFFTIDRKQVRQDFSRIPGLPGRSLVSDTLCEKMVHAYQQMPKHVFDAGDENLNSMRKFAENCQRRSRIEQEMKRQQGLDDNDQQHVSIPYPGFL